MPIRVECAHCQSVLQVKDALAGREGKCPQCGGVVVIPKVDASATPVALRPLGQATAREMMDELGRRQRSAVLVVFETPASGQYDLSHQPAASVRCYRTEDMTDGQMMQVLGEVGHMTQGTPNQKGGVGLCPDSRDEPFEFKGDRLGMKLADFKAKYARTIAGMEQSMPLCSDSFPGQAVESLMVEAWQHDAGIVHARIDLPTENNPPTVAGVKTERLIYQFVDGLLFRITAVFDTEAFHLIRTALGERYGAAAEEMKESGSFVWRNEVSTIHLTRGSVRPKRPSQLHIVHDELKTRAVSRLPQRSSDL